jgi:hypothetical protein
MSMNNPRDPYVPPRRSYAADRSSGSVMGWLIAAVVAVFVVGAVIYGMSDRLTTASNPAASTTGQGGATVNDPPTSRTPPTQKEQRAPIRPVTPNQ